MDSFTEQLRAEAKPIWDRIFAHPFLSQIKDGTLPLEKFRYYLAQDYLYLEGFARCVAMAMAKSPDSQTLEDLFRRALTPIERPLHSKMLGEVGLSAAEIQVIGRFADKYSLCQPHVDHCLTPWVGPHRSGIVTLPVDLSRVEARDWTVRAPLVRPMDGFLRRRGPTRQRERLARVR